MKNFLFASLLFLSLTAAHAQTNPSRNILTKKPEKESTNRETGDQQPDTGGSREQRAKRQITEMKDGVLLVRLRTQENAIKQLEKTNKVQANALKKALLTDNNRLAEAFRKNFTFCPVYFFYSSDSENLLQGEINGMLLNEKLQKDPALKLPEKPIFVAEITNIEQYRPEPLPMESSSSAEISFRALVVRDAKLNQLASPFPYFIKIQQLMPPRQRTEAELVKLLNEDLFRFHKQVTGSAK